MTAFYLVRVYRAKYGIMLLRKSAERLLRLEKGEDFETSYLDDVSQKIPFFTDIEKTHTILVKCDKLRSKYILNYTDAKDTFIFALRLLHYSQSNINPKQNMKMYMTVISNTCNAYKYMALYEKDRTKQILLHKHRANILLKVTPLIYLINPNMLKYLQLQMAIVFSTLIDLKLEKAEATIALYIPDKYNCITGEINALVSQSLKHLQVYMKPK
ncbi:hypothetical protein EAI_09327 [Harpegnathos saltator]|uniref:Uncharacterized protein n=2 Tax=Harpegnathos saltator TaxID=610380 RepID=E2B3V0_HARSA|nr:hypothetical protein EAI_09327 [Harpegnathos saltator]